eukprot:6700331-Prymnesium_polylepis.1
MAEREGLPLHAAAGMGHIALLRRLLACGAAVGLATVVGRETALHVAAEAGVPQSVALLLEAAAPVDVQNVDGDRPLHAAAWSGDAEVVKLLLDAGVAVDAPGHRGQSALAVGAARGHESVVRCLLDEGCADVDAADDDGVTP